MFVICSAIVFFGKVNENYEISKICSMVEISKICKVAAFLSEADPQGSYALMAFSELPANRQKLRAQITKRIAGIRAINRLSGGCCFGLREANLLCRFDCRLGGSVFRVPFGRAKGPQAIAQIQATHRQNSGDD